MKTYLGPLLAVILPTGFCVLGCHLAGMRGHDLWIASAVTFGTCLSAATTAVTLTLVQGKPTPKA